MQFHIAQFVVADPEAAPSPLARSACAVESAVSVQATGYDLSDPAEFLVRRYFDQSQTKKHWLVALADPPAPEAPLGPLGLAQVSATGSSPGEALGVAWAFLPRLDNLHLAMMDLSVRPDVRGQGIGTALLSEVVRAARADERRVLQTWSSHRLEAAPGTGLAVPTGIGELSASDPEVRFALQRGFVLKQGERHSALTLPLPADAIAAWLAQAEAKALPGYRLVGWTGVTPPRWRPAMARLRVHMSTDVPLGETSFAEEIWDAERVAVHDQGMTTRREVFTMAAQHLDSGELVAYTQLVSPDDHPERVYQEDTLVVAAHRGHRLGLWVKAANLQRLAQARPSAEVVHTWNAGENRWMLAVNEQMGFERVSTGAAWELDL